MYIYGFYFPEDDASIHGWELYIKDSLFINNEGRAYEGAIFKDVDGDFKILINIILLFF